MNRRVVVKLFFVHIYVDVIFHQQHCVRPRTYRVFYDKSRFQWVGPKMRTILKLTLPHQKLQLSADDMYTLHGDALATFCQAFWNVLLK